MKHYHPEEVDFIVNGVAMSGFAAGSFITITQVEDSFKPVVGADGQTTRTRNNNRNATAACKLMQTSESNAILSALHEVDSSTPGGAGVVAIMIRDKQGLTLFVSTAAWITKPPTQDFDTDATSREWLFYAVNPKNFVGGN